MSPTKIHAIFIFRENAFGSFFIRGGDKDTWDTTLAQHRIQHASLVLRPCSKAEYMLVFSCGEDATNLCFDLNLPSDGPEVQKIASPTLHCHKIFYRNKQTK